MYKIFFGDRYLTLGEHEIPGRVILPQDHQAFHTKM
jgi:hypothetical protein